MTNSFAMSNLFETPDISRPRLWTGRVLTGLALLFYAFDGIMKLVKPLPVVQATVHLGIPESAIAGIGIVLLICTVLYAVPRTCVLGAVLLTGYLGGAVLANLRADQPIFNLVFPILFGCLTWTALFLRKPGLQRIFFL